MIGLDWGAFPGQRRIPVCLRCAMIFGPGSPENGQPGAIGLDLGGIAIFTSWNQFLLQNSGKIKFK